MNAFRLKQFLQTLMNTLQLGLIENPTSHTRLICNHYQTETHLPQLAQSRRNAGNQLYLLWLREIFPLFDNRAVPIQHDETALLRLEYTHGHDEFRLNINMEFISQQIPRS